MNFLHNTKQPHGSPDNRVAMGLLYQNAPAMACPLADLLPGFEDSTI